MSDMYNFDNNNYNNENHDGFNHYEFDENNSNTPNHKKPNAKMVKFAKKVGAIALSAVLFGGVAAGSYQGVNALFGTSTQTEAQATTSTKSSLLKTTSSTTSKGTMDVTDIVKSAMPSIVSITSKSVQEVENYFGMFGGRNSIQQQEVESAGSGIIIGKNDSELLIATNNHVIDGAETVSVSFVDNETYEATIKGTDSDKDLAVVAVPLSSISSDTMSKISVATIGDSSKLEVGEQVVAIGNALGYGQSVTTGIVSATNRTLDSEDSSEASYDGISLIQTDAAINSGNSGGPLFNMNGEVVGITTAKYSGSTSSGASIEGIGFAIPINDVMKLVDDLMEYGYITGQAYLGVTINSKDLDASTAAAYGLPVGARVESVTEGSCAQKAGLQAGDIITALGDQKVSGYSDLVYALRNFSAGDATTVSVYRAGQELTLQITFDEKTADTVTGPVATTEPTEATGDGEQPSQDEIPESGSYEDWYDYFYRFFGGNGN